jgi:murein DD-endopeptidase MepM/ murein hydrolase activator NlpD
MPYHRSGSYYYHDGYPVHQPQPRVQAAAVHRHAVRARDYILGHAGRQVRLGPVAFWIVVGTLVIMAVWSIGTATYFAFREDVLTRLIGRQAEMQFAYEDRVAELRTQIDRLTSRQLLDQDQFEQKLKELQRRQAVLESRASTLSDLTDPVSTGSIKRESRSDLPAAAPRKPSPLSDNGAFLAPAGGKTRLNLGALSGAGETTAAGLDAKLARLEASLNRVQIDQFSTLRSLEENYDAKSHRMRSVLADLGVDPGKQRSLLSRRGMGGPFIPLKLPKNAGSFERALYRADVARAQVDELSQTLVTVPVRRPVMGEIEVTSGFGIRDDPFLGTPAMHPGIDIRGEVGTPVRATAAGKVTHAGWDGGYGNLVEIDHGNGLSTRYGHLSKIDVSVGQQVHTGQIIGKIGSTGRSTGPHLHYETRINGEAVNPEKFLHAGAQLGLS